MTRTNNFIPIAKPCKSPFNDNKNWFSYELLFVPKPRTSEVGIYIFFPTIKTRHPSALLSLHFQLLQICIRLIQSQYCKSCIKSLYSPPLFFLPSRLLPVLEVCRPPMTSFGVPSPPHLHFLPLDLCQWVLSHSLPTP